MRPDGKVLVTLKTPWHDGTSHLCFEPLTLLERLVALTPRPRINVGLYHGVLAPRAKWRRAAVAFGRADPAPMHADGASTAGTAEETAGSRSTLGAGNHDVGVRPAATAGLPVAPVPESRSLTPEPADAPPPAVPPRRRRWAELLQRVFAVDVLACPKCGDRMRVIATIEDPRVVRRILTHLGLAGDEGPPPLDPCPRHAA